MAINDIALTGAQRSSLLSLQGTQDLSARTQTRLATGRKISSVSDDAVNYFRSKALSDRAGDFSLRKDGIDQGISALNSAMEAITAIDNFAKQMKGIVEASKSQSTQERQAAAKQFSELGSQMFQLIEDASYQGMNLLNSTTSILDVSFGIRSSSRLKVYGLHLNKTVIAAGDVDKVIFTVNTFSSGGLSLNMTVWGLSGGTFTSFGLNNTNVAQAENILKTLDNGISRLRGHAASLGSNIAVLQNRLAFTKSYVSEMTIGSDKLTIADLNEEGANLVALQTRQQLGIQALSVSGKQQQAILTLLQ